jgi:hypothetical protein
MQSQRQEKSFKGGTRDLHDSKIVTEKKQDFKTGKEATIQHLQYCLKGGMLA